MKENYRLRADQDAKPPRDDWWKSGAWYEADGNCEPSGCAGGAGRLRPSIHMPRWASRITLEVTDVRVERLQAITEEDARAEGVDSVSIADVRRQATWCRRDDFAQIWNIINGKRAPWASNPWVWVVSFRRVER